jgi:peroxiredoxin
MKFSNLKNVFLGLVVVALLFSALRFGGAQILPDFTGDVHVAEGDVSESADLIGERAPYFDLPNIAGNHIQSAQFADTPLVIVFWSTWNQGAADQIKILDDYLANGGSGHRLVEIVAINSEEERSVVASFMRRGGYAITTLLDTQGVATEAYRIKGLPTFYFLDRDGIVRARHAGVLSQAAIGDKVEAILK